MVATSETLRQGKGISTASWTVLVVAGLIAIALAVGSYAMSTRSTSEPAATPKVAESATVAAVATQDSGLIKNGLQPRPFTMLPSPPQAVAVDVPDGFVRVGTDFRPIPGEQRP